MHMVISEWLQDAASEEASNEIPEYVLNGRWIA